MIDAQPAIAWPAVPQVTPVGVHRRVGMQRPDRIAPAPPQKLSKPLAGFGLNERIFVVCR